MAEPEIFTVTKEKIMFEIKQATRQGINPLIVAYSESGNGKTYSALLLARGLAGKAGKIVVADSESGRASLYADVLPGGFETFEIAAPFSPARYVEAVDAIEASGAAVGIIDSGSHEHEGPGGVLDMAMENEHRSGRAGLHNWKTPKFEHAKYVQRLLRIKIPIIICLRAKFKTRQGKDEHGKTVIIKDDHVSPIAAEDFIFEATAHFQINPNHSIILTKCSHPSLRDCFPKDNTTPITIEHGNALRAWCSSAGSPAGVSAPSATVTPPKSSGSLPDDDVKALKKEIWELLKPVRGAARDWSGANSWLWAEDILDAAKEPVEKMPDISAAKMLEVILKAKKKLGQKV
jgi:hypothetical protein